MMTRRTFIKTTSFASFAALMSPRILRAATLNKNIGLQLYTLRDAISRDLPGTIASISAIGYTWLEAAGYNDGKFYGLQPREFKKMADDLGMQLISSHATFEPEQQQQAIEAHATLGVRYLVYPMLPVNKKETKDHFSRAAAHLNDIGEACRASGLKFGYHNHAFEFVKIDDTTGFDILLELTDSELVCFESDLYWMIYAGSDPLSYFGKYPGRFELWHVKDMEANPEKDFAPVGTGIIDYKQIFGQKQQAGLAYFFVEQDDCKIDPLESVKISFKNLKKIVY
ncbi:MAG: sugar phosphate isomerase/epimerase [Bacteroidales bacterium]|nr:sugar phosphate isomerase/epimerase [Bacteroidales bacterium]